MMRLRFRVSALITLGALIFSLLAVPSQASGKRGVSISTIPSTVVAGQFVSVWGKTTGSLKGANVRVQVKIGNKWKTVKTIRTSKKTGRWSALVRTPKTEQSLVIRAFSGSISSKLRESQVLAPLNLVSKGPGERILGVDLSRWQSSGNAFDFARMAKAGVAFAFIKASDGLADEDALAIPHVSVWAPEAKAAGILVGYYHRARLPLTTDPNVMIADAKSQAANAASRLAALGGYDERTLPYVLDVEGVNSKITDEMITLWTFTWLDAMESATSRKPIMYSYRSFLASRYLQDQATVDKFRSYHLWLAQPGNPADPAVKVGQSLNGKSCYQSAWKQSDCSYVWTFWQYTNSGDREKYGIPWNPKAGDCPVDATLCFPGRGSGRNHLDLNVFNGSAADLTALLNGSWLRTAQEYR